MKHSHGNLIVTIIPILILATVGAGGWYFYHSEVNNNQSLIMENISQQGTLNNKLENLQTTIDKLLEDRTALQGRLVSEKKTREELAALLEKTMAEKMALETSLQQEVKRDILPTAELERELEKLAALLEKTMAEKMAMETNLRKEVNRGILNTAELETELAKRQAAQKSLHDEMITVSGEKSQLLNQLEQEQESKKHISNLKSRLEQELNEKRVEISQLNNQVIVIKLSSEVLFSPGSAQIKPAGQKVLSVIAETLNAHPDRTISVEGHTDNLPIIQKDRYESNWELSAARSLAAVDYFQRISHIDPGRLKVVGYGQYHPVSSNETAEGRKRNRRIEFRLIQSDPADLSLN